jgi:hypothetical protein
MVRSSVTNRQSARGPRAPATCSELQLRSIAGVRARGCRLRDPNLEGYTACLPEVSHVPAPRELAEAVKSLRVKLEAFGEGWLFPIEGGSEPWPRDLFDQALRRAEEKAGLSKLDGTLWHGYRRKWATERKPFPEADVMAAGGWKDASTLHSCYQQADEATVLAVMACPTKLVNKKFGANG